MGCGRDGDTRRMSMEMRRMFIGLGILDLMVGWGEGRV